MNYTKQKDILFNAIGQNAVSHAYLFEGPSGAGKTELAQTFAAQISEGVDIKLVTNALFDPKKDTNAISVDTIRGMIEDIYVRPYQSEKKVYIIPNADTLTPQAQNSMLKVLEEPPSYCVIILLASSRDSFLPTILSRVTLLAFKSADTAPEDEESKQIYAETLKHIQNLLSPKRMEMYRFVEFTKKNKKNIGLILNTLTDFLSDCTRLKHAIPSKIPGASQFANKVSGPKLINMTEAVMQTSRYLDSNANFNIAMQLMILSLWDEIHGKIKEL